MRLRDRLRAVGAAVENDHDLVAERERHKALGQIILVVVSDDEA